MKTSLLAVLLSLTALFSFPSQPLAAALPSQRATAQVVGRLTDSGQIHGLVVGYVSSRGQVVYGFGHRGEDRRSKAPDGKTVFDIGSITKTFTGLLLAQSVMMGQVHVSDAIGPFLPPGLLPAKSPLARLTFLDLATHTAGLPAVPDNLPGHDPRNPMAGYSTERLLRYLATADLSSAPGREFLYSNTGAALCGFLVARLAHTDYATLVRQRICEPLGLHDTRIALSPDMAARMTHGHDEEGRVVPNWSPTGLEGAGALRSTAEDLLTYAAANLGLIPTPLLTSMKLAQMVRCRMGTLPSYFIGLFWNVANYGGRDYVLHAGRSGGYFALLLLSPEDGCGVVLLSDTQGDFTTQGWRLLELLVGREIGS